MTQRRRLDLYAECNVEPRAPMEQFTAQCCMLCVNPECIRSRYGNSKFEARVASWYERLFADVPKMLPTDERFGKIAGQKFLLIDPDRSSTPSQGWVDPRDLEPTRVVQVAVQLEPSKPSPPDTKAEPPAPEPARTSVPAQLAPACVNTPVQQGGQMIGGKAPTVAPDWRPPPPLPSTEDKVVKTGAKVRLGS